MPSWGEKPITVDPTRFLRSLPEQLSINYHIRSLRRRPYLLVFILIIATLIISPLRPPLPPSYKVEWALEKYSPQVDPRKTLPGEGKNGRFLRFRPIKETGFNYQLQSLILQQQIAFMSNRSLAYEPYHRVDSIMPVSFFEWPWKSSRIPMSALLYSISNGFEALYGIPRAVPVRHFSRICPRSRTRRVLFASLFGTSPPRDPNVQHAKLDYEVDLLEGTSGLNGQTKMDRMAEWLKKEEEHGCLEIVENPFDTTFFETHAPVEIYESLSVSPVLKHFAFSPRVLSIINRSLEFLSPNAKPYELAPEVVKRSSRPGPWKNLLALHLRTSSTGYCESLGERIAPMTGYNKLPSLPGNENVPPPEDMVYATRIGLYKAKCAPATLDIIARARRMRANHPLLNSVYILSNGDFDWVEDIRMWLLSDGWERVVVTGDVITEWDDQEMAEAVDTEIARRSGVFVGNGFSTLSSNVALLRTKDGRPRDYTQYW